MVLVDGERAVLRAEGRRPLARRSRTGAPPARAGPRSRGGRRRACVARSRRRPAPSGRPGSAAPGRRRLRGSASGPMRRFFAHSISAARSPAGRNLKGARSRLPIWRSRSAFDGTMRPSSSGREVAQLAQRGGVERAGANARHAERGEPRAELAPGLVGERDRHDLGRVERSRGDLLGDAPRDRRRLAGAGARRGCRRARAPPRRRGAARDSDRRADPPGHRSRRAGRKRRKRRPGSDARIASARRGAADDPISGGGLDVGAGSCDDLAVGDRHLVVAPGVAAEEAESGRAGPRRPERRSRPASRPARARRVRARDRPPSARSARPARSGRPALLAPGSGRRSTRTASGSSPRHRARNECSSGPDRPRSRRSLPRRAPTTCRPR